MRYNDHNMKKGTFVLDIGLVYDQRNSPLSLLAKEGLFYEFGWESSIRAYLIKEIITAQSAGFVEYRHTSLGWQKNANRYTFQYDVFEENRIKSYYYDTSFKFHKGDKSVYDDLLKEIVWPSPTLTLAMAIGFSSVVNSRMQDLIAPESILVNLCGASSTGKTTAEMLMVSAFASPTISNSAGLIHTFNSTENALYAGIANIHGLPMVLDDTTTNLSMNLPRLLYSLSSNQDKARCNQNGTLKVANRDWSGTIILSSETPIHELQSENQGLKVRVLQTQGITWTPDASTAEKIKNVVQNHYGHIGLGFAQYVATFDDNDLLKRHQDALGRTNTLMIKRDKLTDRLASKYAVIGMTLTLMKEHFNFSIDEQAVLGILIKAEQDNFESRDIAQKAFQSIIDFIVTKRLHFTKRDSLTRKYCSDGFVAQGDNYGTIFKFDDYDKVYIPTDKVRDILNNAKILETASVFTEWKRRGIILTDKDRNDIKLTGDKNSPYNRRRCMCFLIKNGLQIDDIDTYEREEDAEKARKLHEERLKALAGPPISDISFDDDAALNDLFDREVFGIGENDENNHN